MIYTEDDIKKDLLKTNVKEFYMKYLLRADNWYFERILNIDEKDIIHAVDDFKMLVSDAFDIGFNNTVMVGSAKLGMSLSPKNFISQLFRYFSKFAVPTFSFFLFIKTIICQIKSIKHIPHFIL